MHVQEQGMMHANIFHCWLEKKAQEQMYHVECMPNKSKGRWMQTETVCGSQKKAQECMYHAECKSNKSKGRWMQTVSIVG
jgi:hypothetical protein